MNEFMEAQKDMSWSERINYVNENMSEHQREMRNLWVGDSTNRADILYVVRGCSRCHKDFVPYPLNIKIHFETHRICYTPTCNKCLNPFDRIAEFFQKIGKYITLFRMQIEGQKRQGKIDANNDSSRR